MTLFITNLNKKMLRKQIVDLLKPNEMVYPHNGIIFQQQKGTNYWHVKPRGISETLCRKKEVRQDLCDSIQWMYRKKQIYNSKYIRGSVGQGMERGANRKWAEGIVQEGLKCSKTSRVMVAPLDKVTKITDCTFKVNELYLNIGVFTNDNGSLNSAATRGSLS